MTHNIVYYVYKCEMCLDETGSLDKEEYIECFNCGGIADYLSCYSESK